MSIKPLALRPSRVSRWPFDYWAFAAAACLIGLIVAGILPRFPW